jgi:anti-sigma regulatory factor (Ser/Thr protein kinase)
MGDVDFWRNLFNSKGFVPRTLCGDWSGGLISLHVVSDAVIWLAYLWIPLVMIWSYQKHRHQLKIAVPVGAILTMYVLFITACGWTHFFDALMFYKPVYRINGLVRFLTAVVSFGTAVSLVRLMPAAISAPITIIMQKMALRQQQRWLHDILDAATDGVLKLCEAKEELPAPLVGEHARVEVRDSKDLRRVRAAVQELMQRTGFPQDRVLDLVSALHEAVMNALVHAHGATVNAFATTDLVQVWIEDKGAGIPLDKLPIATLKQGFSTAGTAGQGWFLVLTFVDRAYLVTGLEGTTLVIEMAAQSVHNKAVPFSSAVGGDVAFSSGH